MVSEVGSRLAPQARVLDVGCGTGDLMVEIQKLGMEGIGLDPSERMIDYARPKLPEARFLVGGSEAIDLPDAELDGLVSAFAIRNFSDRQQSLTEWHRVLKPGGVGGVMEIFPPSAKVLKTYWQKVIPAWGRLIGHPEAYQYLRDSVTRFVDPLTLCKEISSAGLVPLGCQRIFGYGMVSLVIFEKANE